MKVTLKIEGISCNSCAKTIENHLINKQCSKINVSSVLGEASFEIKQDFPVKEITDSLSKLGYPSKEKNKNETKEDKPWDLLLIKLIICTLFTIPLLLHMVVHNQSILNNPIVSC